MTDNKELDWNDKVSINNKINRINFEISLIK